jgi:Tfp pilus assembly protein PilV
VISLTALRRALDRRRLAMTSDGGFSLLEAVVALMIAAGVFSAISVALVQTVRASVQARQSQIAADLMNRQVEYVRALDFSKATEYTADIASDLGVDPLLSYNSGQQTYYLTTSAGLEPLVIKDVGLLPQHKQVIRQQNTDYTVRTYITTVTDATNAAANYRRITVTIEWSVNGKTHTRKSSSFFTETRRGLALPKYSMGTAGTYKTNVGATLALPIKITNVGAPDAFNLSATAPPSGTWAWYVDSDGDGAYTAADTLLGDIDADGTKDTGPLQTNQSMTIFAVRTVAVGEPTTQTVTFTARSSAQPSATTAVNSFSDQVLVNPAQCTCTLTTYYLHNSATNGNTVYQTVSGNSVGPMYMDKTAPAATRTTLYDYSTDCSTATSGAVDCASVPAGRYVRFGGGASETDKAKVAAWYYPVPLATTINGTASVTIWARVADGSGSAGTLTAYIGSDNNNSLSGSFVVAGSGTVTFPVNSPAGWQPVTIGIPISSAFSINKDKNLVVRVVASGSLNLRVGYDTSAYNAQTSMPVTAGG